MELEKSTELPREFKRKSFNFKVLERKDRWALLEVTDKHGKVHFEVSKISVPGLREFNGQQVMCGEKIASDNMCGLTRWVYSTQSHKDPQQAARSKFNEMVDKSSKGYSEEVSVTEEVEEE